MDNHLVIIGGVAAGTKAAAKAKRENPNLKISLYTDEEFVSYSACGLPYYIGGLFDTSEKLIIRTKEKFKEKEDIDIFLKHKAFKILPDANEILIKNINKNEDLKVKYSHLLIATGARPFIPEIMGINANNVFTLRSITDGIAITEKLSNIKQAVIMGGGYIGVEMLEAFVQRGINTTIIEKSDQLMATLDKDMAEMLENYLREEVSAKFINSIDVITGDSVNKIITNDKNEVIQVQTESGKLINSDLVLVSVGVRPNVELAIDAGIEIGQTGAIKVNSRMQTNIKNIYAAGDCAEQIHLMTEKPVWIPLGSTANKQGRVAAINITGGESYFEGVLGSGITKIFDYTVAITGINEKQAQKEQIEYEMAIIHSKDKAGYMPDAKLISIKLLAEKNTRKLIGAQILGKGDVDKRINIIATALTAEMTVEEFLDTDLAYAPPYSTAIDPILKAAQVLENKLHKKLEGITCSELKKHMTEGKDTFIVNTDEFRELIKTNSSILKEYKNKEIILYCKHGMHSYIMGRKLKNEGHKDVKFVDGGLMLKHKK